MLNKPEKMSFPRGYIKKVTGIIMFFFGLITGLLLFWLIFSDNDNYPELYPVLGILAFVCLILVPVGIILFFQGRSKERKLIDNINVQHTITIAKASLVIGIICICSIPLPWVSHIWIIGMYCCFFIPIGSVVAIVLAGMSMQDAKQQGIKTPKMAKIGLVLGIIVIAFMVSAWFLESDTIGYLYFYTR